MWLNKDNIGKDKIWENKGEMSKNILMIVYIGL